MDEQSHQLEAQNEFDETPVLLEFFRQATQSLDQLMMVTRQKSWHTSSWKNLSEIRHLLLSKQMECLSSSIMACIHAQQPIPADYTSAQLQASLQALHGTNARYHSVAPTMELMNNKARKTFCYLVLWYEFQYDNWICTTGTTTGSDGRDENRIPPTRSLTTAANTNNLMQSCDVLEFCGLCCAAVRISAVRRYIQYGEPIFPNMIRHDENTSSSEQKPELLLPQHRLQHVQRLFLRAIGYDPDFGTQMIQEMFYDNSNVTEIDTNVVSTFREMEQLMEQTLCDITNNLTNETFFGNHNTNMWNDSDDVTRIVGVTYSEKYIDAQTGQEIMSIPPDEPYDNDGAPRSLTMTETTTDADDSPASTIKSNNNDALIQQAALLQQEILGELLSMREEEREKKLTEVNATVQKVMDHMTTLSQPHDRIHYLTNLDADTQRCMAMKKIWDTMIADHGHQAPRTIY